MVSYKKVDLILTIIFILFGVYLLILFSGFFWYGTPGLGVTGGDILNVDDFDPAPPEPASGDSMTWAQFKEIEHRNTLIQQERDLHDRSSGNSMGGVIVSSWSIDDCDTCSTLTTEFSSPKTMRYYLGISGYRLRRDTVFHFRNGRNYLRYPSWDSVHTRGENRTRFGHYVLKEVPFRYVYTNFDNRLSDSSGQVLVPISRGAYKVLSILIPMISGLFLVTILYICVGLPAKILIRIAQGQVFIRKNIRQLYLAAITIPVAVGIMMLLHAVVQLVFRRYLIPDLQFGYGSIGWDNGWFIALSLVFFLVARAFKKGYDLQHEQDLTI